MKTFTLILILICSSIFLLAQDYDAIIIKQCKECKLVQKGKTKSVNPVAKNISKLYIGDELILSDKDEIAIQITSNNVRILKHSQKDSTYTLKIIETSEKSRPKGEL